MTGRNADLELVAQEKMRRCWSGVAELRGRREVRVSQVDGAAGELRVTKTDPGQKARAFEVQYSVGELRGGEADCLAGKDSLIQVTAVEDSAGEIEIVVSPADAGRRSKVVADDSDD